MTTHILLRDGTVLDHSDQTPSISLADYLAHDHAQSTQLRSPVVALQATDDAQALIDAIQHGAPQPQLVSIEFAKFTDGRGYSQAALLRQQLGEQLILRAVGDVLIDQLFYMLRVGFSQLALRSDQSLIAAQTALTSFTVRYQATHDQPAPLYAAQRQLLSVAAI